MCGFVSDVTEVRRGASSGITRLAPQKASYLSSVRALRGVRLTVGKDSRPRACPTRLSVPLYETEAMAKRIAAERSRPVLGVLKHLFLLGTSIERPRQGRLKIINMNVEMHGRPVSLVSARLFRVSRGSGACPLLQQADLRVASAEHRQAGHRCRGLRESKSTCIE